MHCLPTLLRTARLARNAACGAALALLAGCAHLVPQTMALRTDWPQGVPQRVEVPQVPFFPQDDYQCGPAALATVLVHDGIDIRPEALVSEVWLPSRRGSLQLEMLATARRHDRVSYRLQPDYQALLREVAAGNPVIVLQDVGLIGETWHYAVVNGFDYDSGTIYLRSGTNPRRKMPFTAFERSWMKSHYWAMVALPPDRIAATADEDHWLQAVTAMARSASNDASVQAYATALEKWPDSLPAAIGLANHLHARGSLPEATGVLRQAMQRHPQSVIVINNLAQMLSDQGDNREALALIQRAMELQSPFAAEVRSTRALILERMQTQTGAQGG